MHCFLHFCKVADVTASVARVCIHSRDLADELATLITLKPFCVADTNGILPLCTSARPIDVDPKTH